MADNYLYAQRRPDPFQSFLQGITGGQQIIGNMNQQQMAGMKNQMLQMEMEKQKAVKNALAGVGKEGFDPQKVGMDVMSADPALGIQLINLQRSMNQEQLKALATGAEVVEKFGPALMTNPQLYPHMQARLKSMGVPDVLPPFETFIGPDGQFNNDLYQKAMTTIAGGSKLILEQAKQQFEPPKYHYVPTQDEQGNAILNRVNEKTNVVEQLPIKGYKQGMTQEVQLPDGTVMRMSTGGKPGQPLTGLQPGNQKDVEEKLLGATDTLRKLTQLTPKMDKEFQTYLGQGKQFVNTTAEKLGFDPSPEAQDYTRRFTQFHAEAKSLHSAILKSLSGMAVTATEEQRIKDFTIDPNKDSYTQAKSKLDNLRTDTEAVIARTNYIRKNGISAKNAPDDIKSIMLDRRKAITNELQAKKFPKERIDQEVRARMEKEFFNPAASIGLVE